MLESIQAVSLLTIMEIVGPVLLLAVLIYGTLQCRAEGAGQHRPSEKPPRASSIGRALEQKSGKKQVRRRRGKVHQPTAAPAIGRRWPFVLNQS